MNMATDEAATAQWDVGIVGGGPAGLSAALMLGRCRRRTLVIDAGRPRNAPVRGIHGFHSRDGVDPAELRRIALEQLTSYSTVKIENDEVVAATEASNGFSFVTRQGKTHQSRKLLLATGVVDALPSLPGIEEMYGTSVFHCQYCDGYEQRNKTVAAYGRGESGIGLALELRAWTERVVLFTDGSTVSGSDLQHLQRARVRIVTAPVRQLHGRGGMIEGVDLRDGTRVECQALFVGAPHYQASALAIQLGCGFTEKGAVATSEKESAGRGLYVAGDASGGEQLIAVAVAEGVRAAIAIHRELLRADLP